MTSDDINKLISSGKKKITLERGIHKIISTININKDNVEIVLKKGARLEKAGKVNPLILSYPGIKGFKITGSGDGVIYGGDKYGLGNMVCLVAAKDVEISGVIFEDICGCHAIDICGCKNVVISSNKFKGYIVNPEATFREAIQIDFASYQACPYFGNKNDKTIYNGAVCDGIKITSNIFCSSDNNLPPLNAIGTHSAPNSATHSKNVFISDNVGWGRGSLGTDGAFVSLVAIDKAEIYNNVISNYGRGIRLFTKTKSYNPNGSAVSGNKHSGCNCVSITDNMITFPESPELKSIGIYAKGDNANAKHTKLEIKDNKFIPANNANYLNKIAIDLFYCDNPSVPYNSIFDKDITEKRIN